MQIDDRRKCAANDIEQAGIYRVYCGRKAVFSKRTREINEDIINATFE